MMRQMPISLNGAKKDELRTQFGALCYRIKRDKVQVLLVTSRGSRRWIVPKGWPMEARTPASSALQEAWEEAGVIGRTDGPCLGVFTYAKDRGRDDDVSCIVMLYPIAVKELTKKYPETGQRRRRWVSRKKAAKLVEEPDLALLILGFDPRPGPVSGRLA